MEEEKMTPKNELDLEGKTIEEEVINDSRESAIYRRLHEIDIIIEEYEDKLYNEEIYTIEEEEARALRKEYNELRLELKEIKKSSKNDSVWENIPIWMTIYGLLICILGAYPIVPMLPLNILNIVFGYLPEALQTNFFFYALMICYSVVLLLISFFIWLYAFKNKEKRKMFLFLMIIQFVIALVSCLFSYL